jgi:hypothetical protein
MSSSNNRFFQSGRPFSMHFTVPMADIATTQKLLELAASRFDNDISPAERTLLEAVANATDADFSSLPEKDRIIRGDRLSWLCTEKSASGEVKYRGVSIIGGQIEGELNLEWAKISFPLRISRCCVKGIINLRNSRLLSLDFDNTSIEDLEADNVLVELNLSMRNDFTATKGVRLADARIGGDLVCNGGTFASVGDGPALEASGAKVQGSVLLGPGFIARNGVQLIRTTIGGNLICNRGGITSDGRRPALDAKVATIKGSVFLHKFKADGGVDLSDAAVKGDLRCRGGELIGCGNAPALKASGAKVQGSVLLGPGFIARNGVQLIRATIGGSLICNRGEFSKGKGKSAALDAYGAKIQGSVLLGRESAAKEADAGDEGAQVAASLDADVGDEGAEVAASLDADAGDEGAASLDADVKAEGASARLTVKGGVDLRFATIGEHLLCYGSHLIGTTKMPALNASDAKIDGSTYFNGIRAEGEMCFEYAYIARNFQWKDVKSPATAILNLKSAKVGTLFNAQESWPSNRNLIIRDFVYDQIDDRASPNADVQLRWLHLQPQETFSSQPYEQLAKVLKSSGYESEATEVLIAKQVDLRRYGDLWWWAKLWNRVLGFSIGHGYKPHRALLWIIYLVFLGGAVFHDGYRNHLITQSSDLQNGLEVKMNYPKFQPFVYSLDCFLPIIDLRQKGYWLPNANKGYEIVVPATGLRVRWGGLLRVYFWVHTILGWALTTLWLAGFTGLVRRLK